MNVDRERFLLLAAALAACHEATRQPAVTKPQRAGARVDAGAGSNSVDVADAGPPAVAVPVASAPDAGSPAPSPYCRAIAARNDAALKSPAGSCPNYPEQEQGRREELLDAASSSGKFFHYCHEGKGAWAVVVASVTLDDTPDGEAGGCGWTAQYALSFERDPRAPTGAVKPIAFHWFNRPNDHDGNEVAAVFDYDGDGRDELLLESSSWVNGGGGGSGLDVLSAGPTAVGKLKLPFRHDSTVDFDRDGRPDLVQRDTFETSYSGLVDVPVHGASILWHSLPGGSFSDTDAVARAWALEQCPAVPRPLTDGERSDPYGPCALAASCQRVWGRSPQAILRAPPAACVGGAFTSKMLEELVKPAPPLVLAPEPRR